jgi:hypothetical protein
MKFKCVPAEQYPIRDTAISFSFESMARQRRRFMEIKEMDLKQSENTTFWKVTTECFSYLHLTPETWIISILNVRSVFFIIWGNSWFIYRHDECLKWAITSDCKCIHDLLRHFRNFLSL